MRRSDEKERALENHVESPESLYGLALVAFVFMVMIGIVGPVLLMVAGLHWGFKITW